ncbi:cupredoxin domain-containing protein [Methanocella arvoryzae]|nr:cupredoxin family copper-binding protein [Methanocella arvoryzae]
MRRLWILLLAITIVALLAPASAHAATTMVDIKNNMFTPQEITIKAGDTVTWTNQDPATHNVDFDDDDDYDDYDDMDIESPMLKQGETFSHTFNMPGTYSYDCDVHPFMKGKVIVQ